MNKNDNKIKIKGYVCMMVFNFNKKLIIYIL